MSFESLDKVISKHLDDGLAHDGGVEALIDELLSDELAPQLLFPVVSQR